MRRCLFLFLIKHSNLFLIKHFSVLLQNESLRLTNSHFVQLFPLCAGTHILSIFNIYPLHNSRIVRYNSGIGGQSENSHFAQDNSGIVPILTLRRTYTLVRVRMSLPHLIMQWSLSIMNVQWFSIEFWISVELKVDNWSWIKLKLKVDSWSWNSVDSWSCISVESWILSEECCL